VLAVMNAFQEAVEKARQQLSLLEGKEVTEAEMIRRANLPASRKRSVAYHLNPNVDRKRGHQVPADIVEALADVLLIPTAELAESARVAAGFQRETGPRASAQAVYSAVERFMGDEEVDPRVRDEVEDKILEVLLRMRRKRREQGPEVPE